MKNIRAVPTLGDLAARYVSDKQMQIPEEFQHLSEILNEQSRLSYLSKIVQYNKHARLSLVEFLTYLMNKGKGSSGEEYFQRLLNIAQDSEFSYNLQVLSCANLVLYIRSRKEKFDNINHYTQETSDILSSLIAKQDIDKDHLFHLKVLLYTLHDGEGAYGINSFASDDLSSMVSNLADLKTPKALTFLEDLLSANYNEKTLNLVRCIYDQAIELRDSDLLSDNARHSIVQIISRSLKLLTSYGRRDISDTYESEDQKVRKYLSSKLVYDNPASLLFVMECKAMKLEELLISKEILDKINIRDEFRNTALHLAIEYYDFNKPTLFRIVHELLKIKDFDVNAKDNEGLTALHCATFLCSENIAKLLLANGADVNAWDNNLHTALHLAANFGFEDITKLLLANGADVNAWDNNRHTALHLAANFGFEDIAKLLLANGAAVNAWDNNRHTPLHFAASLGSENIAKLLLANGADVNAQDNEGHTALNLAAKKKNIEILEFLLRHGADVNAWDNNRHRALHHAVSFGFEDITKLLLAKGADVNAWDNKRHTALHFATSLGSENIAKLLLATKDINVNAWDINRHTALHIAVNVGFEDITKLLLANGADVNAWDNNRHTALHFATSLGSENIAKLLLENRADVNVQDNKGHTALHLAANLGFEDIMKLLLATKDINVNAQDNEGYTALHIAAKKKNIEILEFLSRHGADVHARTNEGYTALHLAVNNRRHNIVKLLLANGADANARTNEGHTALHLAVNDQYHPIVKLLLTIKDINVNAQDNEGHTALHLAVNDKHCLIVKLLLATKEINVNAQNNQDRTALHFAANLGFEDITKLLLTTRDINVNAQDNEGHTALHCAANLGFEDIMKLLLENCADVNVQNKKGATALHCAANLGFGNIRNLLLENCADVNVQNKKGATALHLAVLLGNEQSVLDLLAGRPTISIEDNAGFTALDLALLYNRIAIGKSLLKHIMKTEGLLAIPYLGTSGVGYVLGGTKSYALPGRRDQQYDGIGLSAHFATSILEIKNSVSYGACVNMDFCLTSENLKSLDSIYYAAAFVEALTLGVPRVGVLKALYMGATKSGMYTLIDYTYDNIFIKVGSYIILGGIMGALPNLMMCELGDIAMSFVGGVYNAATTTIVSQVLVPVAMKMAKENFHESDHSWIIKPIVFDLMVGCAISKALFSYQGNLGNSLYAINKLTSIIALAPIAAEVADVVVGIMEDAVSSAIGCFSQLTGEMGAYPEL